jgi:hypothetical protein
MALLRSNFRTEFDAQNEGNGVSGLQISKIFQGSMPPDHPRLRGASSFWDYATVRFLAGSAPDVHETTISVAIEMQQT